MPAVSEVDAMVIALAIEQHAIVFSDDGSLRMLATTHGVPAGSIGILVWALLDGVILALQPLLISSLPTVSTLIGTAGHIRMPYEESGSSK
jgi:predicted nucleic acid-binding protein